MEYVRLNTRNVRRRRGQLVGVMRLTGRWVVARDCQGAVCTVNDIVRTQITYENRRPFNGNTLDIIQTVRIRDRKRPGSKLGAGSRIGACRQPCLRDYVISASRITRIRDDVRCVV